MDSEKIYFSRKEAAEITNINYETVAHYSKIGVITPEVNPKGRRREKGYSRIKEGLRLDGQGDGHQIKIRHTNYSLRVIHPPVRRSRISG